jgi:putative transposase
MCISHSILPKEQWIKERGENVEWPVWGVMGILHMDNAREFRGHMLKAASLEYDIDLMLRPVKKPNYGAHIERLNGTLATQLKKLPGATFSNTKERGKYDSDAMATMSMAELEKWLIIMVAKYHNSVHSGIGMTPLQKYKEGLFGKKGIAPRGLPARRLDEEKIRIDFMPFEERTVQANGVLIDDAHYFANILRPYIGKRDPKTNKSYVFRFRRDPDDISQLYFFDKELGRYFVIPFRDITLPPVSLHEWKHAREEAKKNGYPKADERRIFSFVNRQREIEKDAAITTKTARKNEQRRLDNEKRSKERKKNLPKTHVTEKLPITPQTPKPDSNIKKTKRHFDDED